MYFDLEKVKRELFVENHLRKKGKALKRFLLVLALFVLVEWSLFLFFIGGATISGASMSPKVHNGDFVLFNRLNRHTECGDIVVIKGQVDELYYIKRVIALEGDVVDLTQDGKVTVNGQQVIEAYTGKSVTAKQNTSFPQTVPSGRLFVLGDNRAMSRDSRNSTIGMMLEENVMGTFLYSFKGLFQVF